MRRFLLLFALSFLVFAADPWSAGDVMTADQLAKDIKSPLLLHVGFPVLYRSTHIPGSVYAGPGSTADGIAELKKAVAGQPKDRDIVLYCGCCPMEKCPNIRPAFAALHEMGFTKVRIVSIPTNFKTDWIDKGFPTDKRVDN
jgi:hypothetical protein